MLRIRDPLLNQDCAGFSRRDFLRAGSLGLGTLGLGNLGLPGLLQAAEAGVPLTGKSVVLLFLHGGPPHIEFFDPKMSAPSEIRSITGEIKTSTPGITFGSTFPKLAKMTSQFSIVRSYGSKNSGHTYDKIATGNNKLKASMGSIYSRVAGTNNRETGMPNNVHVTPEAIEAGLKLGSNFETKALPGVVQSGELGPSHVAFNPAGGGQLQQDLEVQITPERFLDRRSLLGRLDGLRRRSEASVQTTDRFQQQAFDVLAKGIGDAFDLSHERLFDAKKLQKWGDMRRVTNLLGHQMLMARRLVERGAGFVTVSDCGWDYHANNNSPKNMAGIYPMGHQVDHAVSAFIEDLHQRGMQDDVLLVVTSEMGRSPKINNNGGRDHYGNLTSLLLAGGGLKMGQVIGKSDRTAAAAATRPYDPSHLLGTVLHTLFDLGELRVTDGLPPELTRLADDIEPIEELV